MKKIFILLALVRVFVLNPGFAGEYNHKHENPYSIHHQFKNNDPCVDLQPLFKENEKRSNIIFRHSSFDDFSAGTVSNSGHNLFVSRYGQIRFINWFDLDNDGYPEIVVVNDHDHYETTDGFIYFNTPGRGFRSLIPPVRDYVPGFQMLEWIEESARSMHRLKTIGGGRTLVADLNGNGYPEILFTNFVHGWSSNHFPVFLYWGGESGYCQSRLSYLPSLSASGLAAADLNGNGRKDIVMANEGREYVIRSGASATYFDGETRPVEAIGYDEGTSFIYWQKAYGYSADNRTELPTEFALDVAVADLNQNGYTDIVFLQAGIPGSIRIFQGKSGGVDVNNFIDIPAISPSYGSIPRKLLVADLNGNGRLDIFVPSAGEYSEIFWNTERGFSSEDRSLIPSRNAIAASAADLNSNGFNDLVVVNYLGPSRVYWGSTDGFSEDNSIDLPTNGGTGVAIADLNNNGFLDLVFSNSQEGESFDTPSFIYWGSSDGFHPADRDELFGYGAVDVALGDFNRNGNKDVFLMNRQSGTRAPQFGTDTYNPTDLFVFWGNPRARYSVAAMSALPGVSAQSCAMATDINGNGHADFIYTTNRGRILNVFFGNDRGYCDQTNLQFELPFSGNDVLAADLNRNGYLDIIVGSRNTDDFAVLPGKEGGFGDPELFDFGMSQYTAVLGDIDGDGNLDLVLGGHGSIRIIYGIGEGFFDKSRVQTFETGMFTRRLSLADFNGDGMLDIFGHHFSKADELWENNHFSAIYWNSNGSFSPDNRIELPSHGAHSGSVADINRNGYVDILIANYNSQFSRNLETFIYWGDKGGDYSPERMTGLPGYSPVSNLVLDLNGNGINDIVAFNHSKSDHYAGLQPLGGIHGAGSFIYWGTEEGWSIDDRDHIPSIGPHSRLVGEPGDVMRRSHFEEYTSSPLVVGSNRGNYTVRIEGDNNFRQDLKLFIRTADSEKGLGNRSWREISQTERSDSHFLYRGSLGRRDIWIQYLLRFDTGGTGTGPVVKSVEMTMN